MRRRREALTRKNSHEAHGESGSLRWLLTYADMITLLMAFFIMLYSMSILNLSRFRQVAVSIRSGMDGTMSGQGRAALANGGQMEYGSPLITGEYSGVPWEAIKEMQVLVHKTHLEDTISFRQDERGIVISLVTDKALYAKGQADLSAESKRILSIVADLIKKVPNQVMVEGHTCDLPVSSAKYPSNWELSTARAATVVRYFIEQGIPASRLSAAGYADSKPLPFTGPLNRERNRRVDVIILKSAQPSRSETTGDENGILPQQ